MSLKNLSIAAASTLVYKETEEFTFYLEHKDLKRVVAGLGGIGTDSITGKTNLVVLGDTSRERNKKGEDKWHTSGRCKQLAKQQEQHDARQRKVPFKVVDFKAFVKEYGLEEVVERELVTAHFENEKKMEKKFKAPGSARTSSQARHNHPRAPPGCLAGAVGPSSLTVHPPTRRCITTRKSRSSVRASSLPAQATTTAPRWASRGRRPLLCEACSASSLAAGLAPSNRW